MKVHVYIATTQGLVAVQRIHPLDPEICSVVSINGTSSVATISSAYHNFVKKGAGIIEADFGGQSYRVNIDAQIDQGNSWQLALYLAHAAHARGVLGDGKVQPGDLLICATGEVNTSDRRVMPVAQVPLKLDKAKAFIEQLAPSTKRLFLLPQANYAAVIAQYPQHKLVKVASLEQALAYLPTQAASTVIEPNKTTSVLISTSKITVPKWLVITGVCLIVILAVFVWSILEQQDLSATASLQSTQTLQLSTSSKPVIDGQTNTETANNVAASLVLTYGQHNNCDEQKVTTLLAKAGYFASSARKNLCSLRLTIAAHYQSAIAINLHSHKIIRLVKDKQTFEVPLPANSASYIVVAFSSSLSSDEYRQLWSFLFNLPDNVLLNADNIAAIPALQNHTYALFSHTLK